MTQKYYKKISRWAYSTGIHYHVWHCIVAMLFLVVGILIGYPFFGYVGGILWYWIREYLQYVYINKPFLWSDVVYPTITNTILYIFLIL